MSFQNDTNKPAVNPDTGNLRTKASQFGRKHLLFLLITVGFGLFRGWSILCGSPTLFLPSNSTSFRVDISLGFLEDIIYFLVVALLCLLALRFRNIHHETIMIASSFAVIIGIILFLTPSLLGSSNTEVPSIGRLLFAFGGCVDVLWGVLICVVDMDKALTCISGGYAISYAIALTGLFFSFEVLVMLQVLLPSLSLAAWFVARRKALNSTVLFPIENRNGTLRSMPFRILFGIGIFGAILLLANSLSEGKTTAPDELLTLIAGLLTSAAIFIVSLALPHKTNFTLVFRLISPIVVACFFLVFFIEADQQPYEVIFIGFSWTFIIILAWELWVVAAQRSTLPPLAVLSFASFVLSLCALLSSAFIYFLKLWGAGNLLIIAIACVASVLVSTFLLSEQQVNETMQDSAAALNCKDDFACRQCVEKAAIIIGLTEREQIIAIRILQGADNASISTELFIANTTLYTHLRHSYKKAGVHSKQEFIRFLKSFA